MSYQRDRDHHTRGVGAVAAMDAASSRRRHNELLRSAELARRDRLLAQLASRRPLSMGAINAATNSPTGLTGGPRRPILVRGGEIEGKGYTTPIDGGKPLPPSTPPPTKPVSDPPPGFTVPPKRGRTGGKGMDPFTTAPLPTIVLDPMDVGKGGRGKPSQPAPPPRPDPITIVQTVPPVSLPYPGSSSGGSGGGGGGSGGGSGHLPQAPTAALDLIIDDPPLSPSSSAPASAGISTTKLVVGAGARLGAYWLYKQHKKGKL